MRLPAAFLEPVRALDRDPCLAFLQYGEPFVAIHPRADDLAEATALVLGWARLIDRVIQDGALDADAARDEEGPPPRLERRAALEAFDALEGALADLGAAPDRLPVEGADDPATELAALRAFLAHVRALAAALDGVRAPAWRRRWGAPGAAPGPFSPDRVPGAASAGDVRDGLVHVATAPLHVVERRVDGRVRARLSIDLTTLVGERALLEAFDPDARGDDREIELYDWIDRQLDAMDEASVPPRPSFRTCAFCGKSSEEVRKLIAGPTACICDECIGVCNDVLAG